MISIRYILALGFAAAVGAGVSLSFTPAMAMSATMPAMVAVQADRRRSFAVAFSYYVAGSWPLTTAARYFWRDNAAEPTILLWIGSSCLLALPWAAAWTTKRIHLAWRIPIAAVTSVVPPIGLIGWANPVNATGILFPGTAWLGLVLVIFGLPWIALRPRAAACMAVVATMATNHLCPQPPPPPPTWEAVDTSFGDAAKNEYAVAMWVQQRALQSQAQVLVFPESVVPVWTEATELFWQATLRQLEFKGKTIVFGAGLPRTTGLDVASPGDTAVFLDVLLGQRQPLVSLRLATTDSPYFNAVLARGAEKAELHQRVPVPIGMWKPWKPDAGVPLNAFGPGVLPLRGRWVAVLVCYEALLAWPALQAMTQRPALLAVIANDHWDRSGTIARCQRAAANAWARLFQVPVVVAINR
jgi:hypothetical protein